ncbi:MAG: hypothetical protein HKN98_10375 [Silicimonas sp.]|nr:hypothetical protein [Silicimonas sp.]
MGIFRFGGWNEIKRRVELWQELSQIAAEMRRDRAGTVFIHSRLPDFGLISSDIQPVCHPIGRFSLISRKFR